MCIDKDIWHLAYQDIFVAKHKGGPWFAQTVDK
jgi:hypothetical protein